MGLRLPVAENIRDSQKGQAMLSRDLHKIIPTRHGTVFVQDLSDDGSRLQTRKGDQINRSFRVADPIQ